MSTEHQSRCSYWKEYFSRLISDDSLSNSNKLVFSNDHVRFQTYSWMIEAIGPVAGLTCLDVGCGTGDLSRVMDCMGAHVDAFDLAEPAIVQLRQAHPGIRWFAADVTNMGASSVGEAYDVVTASEVLQHVDAVAAIRALWQRVAPGGRLVAAMPNADCPIVKRTSERYKGYYSGVSISELSATLAGLDDVDLFRWRGAFFLADQRLVPYEMSSWFEGVHDFGAAPPNRLQFVAVRKPPVTG